MILNILLLLFYNALFRCNLYNTQVQLEEIWENIKVSDQLKKSILLYWFSNIESNDGDRLCNR